MIDIIKNTVKNMKTLKNESEENEFSADLLKRISQLNSLILGTSIEIKELIDTRIEKVKTFDRHGQEHEHKAIDSLIRNMSELKRYQYELDTLKEIQELVETAREIEAVK